MEFKDLKIIQPLLKAIDDEGYKEPSPIQCQAIPPVLEGKDILGCAQTGTGKTAAFALPIIQILSAQVKPAPAPIASLVLTPTRELAIQIGESFRAYGKYTNLKYSVIFGGVSQVPQVDKLRRGVDVLIATPGRLIDLMNQNLVSLKDIQILVLDEADRMLDMGFIKDVQRIIAAIPKSRQTLFFSATMPPQIAGMANSILRNPVKVEVTPQSTTVEAIEQKLYFVDKVNKEKLLADILGDCNITSALVFTRTKHGADKVAKSLMRNNLPALAIHGDKAQSTRQTAFNSFKEGKILALVATDIAARGIDINELSHVINYDLPEEAETYVHRIGRTGRAGLGGVAISFCCIDEKKRLADIEKLIKKRIPEVQDHPYPMEVLIPSPPKVPQPRRQRTEVAGGSSGNSGNSRGGKSPNQRVPGTKRRP
jgi:Superfamily II DNA and RNA helicases